MGGAGAGLPKTLAASALVVLANVAGNSLMSRGLKGGALEGTAGPLAYLSAFLNPWVMAGVVLLVFWMLARMALLSWADLSYVLPVTAAGYVLTVLSGWLWLGERVSAVRWAGSLLIVLGVLLVGGTEPRTTAEGPGA